MAIAWHFDVVQAFVQVEDGLGTYVSLDLILWPLPQTCELTISFYAMQAELNIADSQVAASTECVSAGALYTSMAGESHAHAHAHAPAVDLLLPAHGYNC